MTLCSLFEFMNGSDTKQNERTNDGTVQVLTIFGACQLVEWALYYLLMQAVSSVPNSHTQLCVLLLPGTITTHAVDILVV